jgi:hypothetical protein
MSQVAIERPLLEPRHATADSWQPDTVLSMQALEAALRQRVERSEQLRQRPRMVYNLRGYGKVVAQITSPWLISGAADEHEQRIVLECVADVQSEACPRIRVQGVSAVQAVADELHRHGLAAIQSGERNAAGETTSAEFQTRGHFPLRLEVVADAASGTIEMRFLNLDGFGLSSRRFQPAQIDGRTIDDLCRFLAREHARFANEPVSSELQDALRARLQQDRQARRADELLLQRLRDEEPRGLRRLSRRLRPHRLLGGLRLLMRRIGGAVEA